MIIDEKQVFNLWDTNGRRSDVLNALSIYLSILKSLEEEYPGEKWAAYPDSKLQYYFYVKAIEASPEVFEKHEKYDEFNDLIKDWTNEFDSKNEDWIKDSENERIFKILDEAIEARARHYTSNLVRIGLATDKRKITSSGNAFLSGKVFRDNYEKVLPIKNTNLILLRQLMKLKIFTKVDQGKHKYYSPLYMALYLLLSNDRIDKSVFVNIVQGTNPYLSNEDKTQLLDGSIDLSDKEQISAYINVNIPIEFTTNNKVDSNIFSKYIKNRKSGKVEAVYYEFYNSLFDYISNKNAKTYEKLKSIYSSNKEKIRKAFCYGKSLFDFGNNSSYSHDRFIEKNKDNIFILSDNLNKTFYELYEKSKYVDMISEYSDTTMRMLGATGIIKTKSALIELSYKSVLSEIFTLDRLKDLIFGEMDEEEYFNYEKAEEPLLGNVDSISKILGISNEESANKLSELQVKYNVSNIDDLAIALEDEVNNKFKEYIENNYPISRVTELLSLFSDRTNDKQIKKEVNESADVPTIYEYVVGIAWYYISNKNFNLYDSLNLTLNANFEPEMHAGGGMGDIVIDYPNSSIMLEVTLMNKSAQKRGEWEPVLRHSINNKVQKSPSETYTFFIADELDYNTINIWRAVAAVPLQSSSSNDIVEGVVIMPFDNRNVINFLNNKISSDKIIEVTKKSFSLINKITDAGWRDEIISRLN